jgi:acetylornithine deacetylase/succinyl-diaminopimelate desuccinylase-like protein
VLGFSGLSSVFAQPAEDAAAVRDSVRAYRAAHEIEIVRELAELLALPNVAADLDQIRRNADHIVQMLERRGIAARLLELEGSPPAVYGELPAPGAERTVIVYAHYDGQPVDPAEWTGQPWQPVVRDGDLAAAAKEVPWAGLKAPLDPEWRIYARSASDDKAPIVGWLTAIDALRAAQIPISVHLKFFFEGEEEAGSPHLRDLLQQHADLLQADGWLLCDGPVHQTRRMQVFFGARGTTDLEMTVYGPSRQLHSGHYGNWAPNPIQLLTELISSMRDRDAKITIQGFYDDVRPLSGSERRALAEMPEVDADLRRSLGLAWSEGSPQPLGERILQPALNLRGILGGHVGAAATNAIPVSASASIDFRLVPDQTPARVRELVEDHIRRQGFFVLHQPPDDEIRRAQKRIIQLEWGAGYPPARTSMDLPVAQAIVAILQQTVGTPIVKMPSLGGSVPMYLFLDLLKTPVIGVPIANHDNNQHAANENLRLQNLWDGIEIYAGILARLGRSWR